jgi:mannose-6-phosphate isomerase
MCKVTVDDQKNDETRETNNNATRATKTLKEYVQSNPELHLGSKTQNDLTYLFKVLSIEKVLSIQSHPDKRLAERLNRERPDAYKDANHKPEMAVALSKEVQAMCGFRPLRELSSNLKAYPELAVLVGDKYTQEIHQLVDEPGTRTVLRNMFRTYLERSPEEVQGQLDILLPRLKAMDLLDEIQDLIIRLSEQFPGDSGIMAPLIFNVLVMTEGQAFFINANEPHAYISGEILECMACSDNVVRAGLTPKLKDVNTLVSMLTYKAFYPDVVGGHKIDDCLVRYEPPVSDFCIEIITVPAGETYEVHDVRSGAVFLTLSGSGTFLQGDVTEMPISFGSSAFGSANTKTTVVAGPDGIRIARAMSNVYHGKYLWQGGSWEMNEYMFDEFE